MIDVALVCPYDLAVPGGVQAHVMQLARHLDQLGDRVAVVAPNSDFRAQYPVDVVSVGATRAVRFNGSVAPIALGARAWSRTRDALRQLDPAIVHVHEPLVPMVGPAAVRHAAAPVVATFHAYAERQGIYRLVARAMRGTARRIDARIAVSRAAQDYHARALGARHSEFAIVPNGVDVAAHKRVDVAGGGTQPNVLFVGRLERRKGLAVLIDAFVALRQSRDATLTVVGDGPERDACVARLPATIRDDVRFLGRLSGEQLAVERASADVTVVPALGGESFGIVLIEALAAGSAVIASDLPGFRDVLDGGVHGRLVPPGDVARLAQALADELDEVDTRGQRAAAARRHVQRFDWSVVAEQLRAIYADLRH